MQERRKFIRIPENSPISYEVLHGKKSWKFNTKDISQGGIRFIVHESIPVGTLLKIELPFHKKLLSFEATIKVVWLTKEAQSERYELGAAFVNISDKYKEHLINYIKSMLRTEG